MTKAKTPAKNVTKVQTPGEQPPADNQEQDNQEQDTGAANDESQAEQAPAAKAKTPASQPASKVENRPSRAEYARMHADEVDPSTLKSAVLTIEGWVCPPTVGVTHPK